MKDNICHNFRFSVLYCITASGQNLLKVTKDIFLVDYQTKIVSDFFPSVAGTPILSFDPESISMFSCFSSSTIFCLFVSFVRYFWISSLLSIERVFRLSSRPIKSSRIRPSSNRTRSPRARWLIWKQIPFSISLIKLPLPAQNPCDWVILVFHGLKWKFPEYFWLLRNDMSISKV